MVRIRHAQNTLQPVDYTQCLQWILEEVQRVAPFRFRNSRLYLEADSLADKIATRRAEKLSNPIIGNSSLMRTSTVYFNDQTGASFETLIAQIYRALHTQLEATLARHQLILAACLASIQTSLSSLKEKGQRGIPGFANPFESTPPLRRKRLRIVPETASTTPPALLRLSRAKLRISGLNTFFGQVEQALRDSRIINYPG